MGDEEAEAATVVVIAPVHAHIAEFHAFAAQSHASDHAHVGEGAVMIVVVEIIGNGIVGDEEIGPTIIIVVHPHDTESVVANVIMDARFDGNFLKGAITTIMIEEVAFAFETPGTTLNENALEAAEFVAAKLGEIVHVEMRIARNKQIDEAVAVVVAPGRASHESAAADSGFFGDILELAIAKAVVQGAAAKTSDKEVELAVIVVIGDGDAHAPAAPRQASFLGDVLESTVGFLVIKCDKWVATSTKTLNRGTVDEDDV